MKRDKHFEDFEVPYEARLGGRKNESERLFPSRGEVNWPVFEVFNPYASPISRAGLIDAT
jgi:hypothetical protein